MPLAFPASWLADGVRLTWLVKKKAAFDCMRMAVHGGMLQPTVRAECDVIMDNPNKGWTENNNMGSRSIHPDSCVGSIAIHLRPHEYSHSPWDCVLLKVIVVKCLIQSDSSHKRKHLQKD